MFYFKEITHRVYFVLCLLISIAFIINSYRYLLILIIFLPLISNNLVINIVYPDPFLIMGVYFELTAAFIMVAFSPFVIVEIIDFLKPGLSVKKINSYKYNFYVCLFFILQINALFINYVMPEIWYYIEDYVISNRLIQHLNIFLEIKLEYYYNVIKTFLFICNLILGYAIILLYFLKDIGIDTLLKFRKVILLVHLLIATVVTPPDVTSQIYIFLSLNVIFEAYLLLSIFLLKSKKYTFKFICCF